MATYTTEGIVLRYYPLGEADKILTIFSKDKGKIKAVAKGARKPTSKFVASAELLTHSVFLCSTGRNMDIVVQTEVISTFGCIRDDFISVTWAIYAAELIDISIGEAEPNPAIFNNFIDYLNSLGSKSDAELWTRRFEFGLLKSLGYDPELERCMVCGVEPVGANVIFSSRSGGLVCRSCGQYEPNPVEISLGTVQSLRLITCSDERRLKALRLSESARREISEIVTVFELYHLERTPKSARILKGIGSDIDGYHSPGGVG